MPQPGGGVQGLGEHHQADGFSGEYTFTVPMLASPSRDFEPDLELTYRSFGGNGTFGLGMDMAASAIARQTSRRVPHYDDSDVFLLDGAQLTPVGGGATTRTVGGTAYTVTPFRPRVETTFSRIERWSADPGDTFWRVLEPGGSVLVYGRSARARVSDPADPGHVAEWLLESALGPHGDARSYAYKQEDDAGIGSAQSETGRVRTANRYLERIRYGNEVAYATPDGGVTPLPPQAWLFELVLDYGEYDIAPQNDDPFTPVRAWSARADPFSAYHFGFERRTHRLCRTVLMFHRFPGALGPDPVLVHAHTFGYDEDPAGSRLRSFSVTGRRYYGALAPGQRYTTRETPVVTLGYTAFEPAAHTAAVALVDVTGRPVEGFDGATGSAVVDLYGEGVPGILYADGESVSYRSPVLSGPLSAPAPTWSARVPLDAFPVERRVGGAVALHDLDGNGVLDLVHDQGFHRSRGPAGWAPFTPFPARAPAAAGVAYATADLAGDGHMDMVWRTREAVGWFPALGEAGYAPARAVPADPALPPSFGDPDDRTQLVTFADLLGGGVACLVRVRDGSIECWPSLGEGRFAPVVRMAGVPVAAGRFDPRRIVFADVDGSGPPALVLVHSDRLEVFRNLAGNGFAAVPVTVPLPAACADPAQLAVVDLYGTGCACFVLSAQDPRPQAWAIDLSGGAKPHLVTAVDDGQGGSTAVTYRSCAYDRLLDKRRGRDWPTRVPFPVQVVAQVVDIDSVSGDRLAVSYRYHDGHYDHVERAFRGFGCVEEADVDTATLEAGAPPTADASAIVPLCVRSWFDTGAWHERAALATAARAEQFAGDALAWPAPSTTFEYGGAVPDAETARQAVVALAGRLLRRERYGLDGSPAQEVPYDVVEQGWQVRMLQPAVGERYGSFLVHERQQFEAGYERDATDPRVQQHFVLALDDHGQVTLECVVAGARRPGAADAADGQQTPRAVAIRQAYVGVTDQPDGWLLAAPTERTTYELTDLAAPDLLGNYWSHEAVLAQVTAALAGTPGAPTATPLEWSRWHYVPDTATGRAIGLQALLLRHEEAVLSDALATATFAGQPVPGGVSTFLADVCGLVLADGYWWDPGWTDTFGDLAAFFRPTVTTDALHAVVDCTWDAHALLPVEVTLRSARGDTLPHTTTVTRVDHLALAACQVRDEHGTVHECVRDPLGAVVLLTSRGTEWQGTGPVPVGFDPLDLDAPPVLPDTVAQLLASPATYLGGAERCSFSDLTTQPMSSASLVATHYPVGGAPGGPIEIVVAHHDSRGRVVQLSQLAEPGPVAGVPVPARWRTDPRSRYNAKGLPFLGFAPSFATSCAYVPAVALGQDAITTSARYDALGRPVRVNIAQGDVVEAFASTTSYGAWWGTHADVNDTVRSSPYYDRYVTRAGAGIDAWDRDALVKAAACSGTPTVAAYDPLGHVVAVRRLPAPAAPLLVETRASDALGRPLWAADARLGPLGLRNIERVHTMQGDELVVTSVDAGSQWFLRSAMGELVYRYGSRGFAVTTTCDGLHRPVSVTVTGGAGVVPPDVVVERTIYGDSLDAMGAPPVPRPGDRGLVGRQWRRYDAAGLTDQTACALTGGATATTWRMRAAYAQEPDWTVPSTLTSWAARTAHLDGALDVDVQAQQIAYDALGRTVRVVDPAGTTHVTERHVSGLVAATSRTPAGGTGRPYVAAVEYDPAGRPVVVTFANAGGTPAVTSAREYDPRTERLRRSLGTRLADGAVLHDLRYHLDPVGNVTHVADAGPGLPSGEADYTVDPLYRLVEASGRALAGYTAAHDRTAGYDAFLAGGPGDAPFHSAYTYDAGDNLTSLTFTSAASTWTTTVPIDPGSNRTTGAHDVAGNALALDGIDELGWDHLERLRRVRVGADTQYLLHDVYGRRKAKIVVRGSGAAQVVERTVFVGGLERHRRTAAGVVVEEVDRSRMTAPDGSGGRLLDWRTGVPPAGATTAWFELTDQLGSTVVEVDDAGVVRHAETYLPFGGTAFAAGAAGPADIALKPARHAGRERDLDTGLYLHGLRSHACWLGRWISPDPALDADGLNLYAFCGNNPVTFTDASGLVKRAAPKLKYVQHNIAKTKSTKHYEVETSSSKMRFHRRIQWAFGGKRNVGVKKFTRGLKGTVGYKVVYLIARSAGCMATKFDVPGVASRVKSGIRKRGHSEGTLLAAMRHGKVHVGVNGKIIDLTTYVQDDYASSTNEACRHVSGQENCVEEVGPELGKLFYFAGTYTGSGDAVKWGKALTAHNRRAAKDDDESEDESEDDYEAYVVDVDAIKDRDLDPANGPLTVLVPFRKYLKRSPKWTKKSNPYHGKRDIGGS